MAGPADGVGHIAGGQGTTTSYSFPGRRPSQLWVGLSQRLEKQTYQQETAPTGEHSLSPLTHTPHHGRRTGLPRRGTWLELAPLFPRGPHPGCPHPRDQGAHVADPRPVLHLMPTWPPWSLGPQMLAGNCPGPRPLPEPQDPPAPVSPQEPPARAKRALLSQWAGTPD